MKEKSEGKSLSCLGKFLIAMIAIPIVMVVVGLAWWYARNASAQSQLDEKIIALDAEGSPYDNDSLAIYYNQLTDNDLGKRWTALADQVEAPEFQQAVRDLPIMGMGEPIPRDPEEPWPDEATVREFFADRVFLLEQFDELESTSGGARYPITFEGYNTLLPYIQASRGLARLMNLRHSLAIRDDDGESATQSVVNTLAVARTLENQPILVSQLVRLAVLGVSADMIRRGLDADVYRADQLDRINQALSRRVEETDQLRIAIIGERGWSLEAFRNGGIDSAVRPPGPLGSRPIDALAALDAYERILAGISDDIYDTKTNLDAVGDELARQSANAGLLEKFDTALTQMLLPAIDSAATAFARTEMTLRLSQTAIAVRQYRFSQGEWPKSLTELSEIDFEVDSHRPIGDKPFGFQVTDSAHAIVWGFPISPTPSFQPMSETPDEPPVEEEFDEDANVFRLNVEE